MLHTMRCQEYTASRSRQQLRSRIPTNLHQFRILKVHIPSPVAYRPPTSILRLLHQVLPVNVRSDGRERSVSRPVRHLLLKLCTRGSVPDAAVSV